MRQLKHTMQDKPFYALGMEKLEVNSEGETLMPLQQFNRFDDDTTLNVAEAVRVNRADDTLHADFMIIREQARKDIPHTEVFKAIKKINSSRSTQYDEVILLACRQVTFAEDAERDHFLVDLLKMQPDDVELIRQHSMIDDLQAYNPLGPNKPFKGIDTGTRDKRDAHQSTRRYAVQFITLHAYHPVTASVSPEIVLGCVAGSGFVAAKNINDDLVTTIKRKGH